MRVALSLWAYRGLQHYFVRPWVNRIRTDSKRGSVGVVGSPWDKKKPHKKSKSRAFKVTALKSASNLTARPLWFHAASVGELEALSPVVLRAAGDGHALVLSIFSPSAVSSLNALVKKLKSMDATLVYWGLSPWEGAWSAWVERFKPRALISHKYEAWPDLWATLRMSGIPIVIIGAQDRRSLRVANRTCRFWMGGPPDLLLLPFLDQHEGPLKQVFSQSKCTTVSDPRWERVFERMKQPSDRALLLTQAMQSIYSKKDKSATPKRKTSADLSPSKSALKKNEGTRAQTQVGLIGSAWVKDIEFLAPLLTQLAGSGAEPRSSVKGREKQVQEDVVHRVWIVPHKVGSADIRAIVGALGKLGISVQKTSEWGLEGKKGAREDFYVKAPRRDSDTQFYLVDEMGVLTELYSQCDWAYVGGGLGDGVHSTIEPAVHGVPIVVGPNRAMEFCEIRQMTQTAQVTVIQEDRTAPLKLMQWWKQVEGQEFLKRRLVWKQNAQRHLGASQKILQEIEKFLGA